MQDLFEQPEKWTPELAAILEKYEELENDYLECEKLQSELEAIGFTCEYSLDGTPFNLKENYEHIL